MPAEVWRKVMKHGTSGVIAIPKPYRVYYKLEAGSRVKILYDSILIVVPEALEHVIDEKRELIDKLLK
ncbi:hypothetical protein DRP04_08920 [Archaeoglobales archaeon]|nr:MAG: hypothetical protein DRP04_08920 [Archaeoglobales archaeon]